MNKHVNFGQKTFLMNGDFFMVFDTKKSIVNNFLNEDFIKDLANMLSSCVLQITTKDGTLYSLTKYLFLHFLNLFLLYTFWK
jgi:hypothetical protein